MPDAVRGTLSGGAYFGRRYRIVKALSVGGMGAVYEVFDEVTQSPRALKVMLPAVMGSAEHVSRFEQEARLTGSIDSEHLVRVLDAGLDGDKPFIVMELLRGEDMKAVLARRGRLEGAEALVYLHQVALALEKTHAAGIIHRDLKPANLFLTRRDDGSPCVKVVDFGVAKIAAASAAAETNAVGTPFYMAPEQARGDGGITARADLLALAHVAYTMLTGEAYFNEEQEQAGSVIALILAIARGPTEAPSVRAHRRCGVRLPLAFDAWFLRATAVDPDARFSGAREQLDALAAALSSRLAWAPAVRTAPMRAVDATSIVPAGAVSTSAPAEVGSRTTPRSEPPPPATERDLVPAGRLRGLMRSRRVWLAGLGVLAALGVAIAVAVLAFGGQGRKHRKRPKRAPVQASACTYGTCSTLEVDDLAHASAEEVLEQAGDLARSVDPDAVLGMGSFLHPSRSPDIDLTAPDFGAALVFYSDERTVSVMVEGDHMAAIAQPTQGQHPAPIRGTVCPLSRAWDVAVQAGMDPSEGVRITLLSVDGVSGWFFATEPSSTETALIEGRSCRLDPNRSTLGH